MVEQSKPVCSRDYGQETDYPISEPLREALIEIARASEGVQADSHDPLREILLQRGWIELKVEGPGLTAAGRHVLRRDRLARDEQRLSQSSRVDEEMPDQYKSPFKLSGASSRSDHKATPASRRAESPLLQLASRKRSDGSNYLGASQVEAGERLRRDFERGQIAPALGINWQRIGETEGAVSRNARKARAGKDLGEGALDAQARFRKAVKSVGEELADPLIDFCCFLKGLEELERDRHWPARSAKLVMSLALSQLARHYGLSDEARGPERNPFRHWGMDDYRPNLS